MLGKHDICCANLRSVKGWLAPILISFLIIVAIVAIGGIVDDYNIRGLTVFIALLIASIFIKSRLPGTLFFRSVSFSISIVAVLTGIVKYFISVDFSSTAIAPYFAYGPTGRIIFIVIICLLLPIMEEIYFRGLLFHIISRNIGDKAGAIITIALFTLIHSPSIDEVLLLALSGALYTWFFYRSGSVIPGILAHCVNNFMWLILTLKLY